MKQVIGIPYGEHELQRLDLYLPDCDSFSLFVYFHGGGIETGDKSREGEIAAALCDMGVAMISANYRLFPEAQYPEFIEDAASVVAWAFEHISAYGACDKIYVGGSSAGGYLSMMLCFDKKWLAVHGMDPMQIAGFYHDAGQPTTHFNVVKARGLDKRRVIVDEAAPLYYIGLDEKYPPMRFALAEEDMQNRKEQTELLLSTMKHFGYENYDLVVRPGKHVKYLRRNNEEGVNEFADMVYDFICSVEEKE